MLEKFRSTRFDPDQFKGQFILTAERRNIPENWSVYEYKSWRLFTLSLHVIDVFDQDKKWLGWCIGHPIVDGILHPKNIILKCPGKFFDIFSVNDFYNRAAGKWILFLVNEEIQKTFLDPYASLSMVFSTVEKTLASTTTLLGDGYKWNEELIKALGLPQNNSWVPAGLTTRINIRRLLPNHTLSLSDWKISRHWPGTNTDLSEDFNTIDSIKTISKSIQSNIGAVCKAYPVTFSLTAGRDSRMLLACARNYLSNATFFTFVSAKDTPDKEISSLIAKRFNLTHTFLPTEKASPDELEQWLKLTGMSVSGSIWKIHKTIKNLDPSRVLLPGMAGEIGRAFYWRPGDSFEKQLSAKNLLKRFDLPLHFQLINAIEDWMSEITFLNTFSLLDLAYVEQRLGCWAAPQHYGNTTSTFELTMFNTRPIIDSLMRLPSNYRRKQQLATDICEFAWPELLEFPFNEFVGVKGFIFSKGRQMKKLAKEIIHRTIHD
ncbi:MAG TPA: hypothetical protein VGP55_07420 [Chitinophagaceae bacterium]|nr:hypothetical protein [Chitinophagaceae bacterium]